MRFVTRARAAVHRIAGKPSVYVDQCEEIIRKRGYPGYVARHLALRADVALGYLESQK